MLTTSNVLSFNNSLTRRQEHIKEVLTGEEIAYFQIRIVEKKSSSIVIDSPGMIAPKTLRL